MQAKLEKYWSFVHLPFILSSSLFFLFSFCQKTQLIFFLLSHLPLTISSSPFHAIIIYYPVIFSHSFPSQHFGSAFKWDFANTFSLGSIHYCNYHSIFFLPLFQSPLDSLPVHSSLKFFLFLALTRRIKESGVLLLFLTKNQFSWRIRCSTLMYSQIQCPIETGYFST